MNAKEYLKYVRDLGQELNAKLELCERLRVLASFTSPHISNSKVSTGTNQGSRLENYAVKVMTIENDLKYDVYKLAAEKKNAINIINEIQTSKYRSVLINYYINCKSWEETAAAMSYSLRNIYYIHGLALQEFKSLHCFAVESVI